MKTVWGIGASLALVIAPSALAAGSISNLVAANSGIGADPRALSGDGEVVGGSSFNGIVQTGTVWSGPNYATRDLVGSFSTGLLSIVTGLSSDGSVAAGWTNIEQSSTRGFVRTADGRLLTMDGTAGALNPYRVSADGSTVVGYYNPASTWIPARWREASGMQPLAGLASRSGLSKCVSPDGSSVAGWLRTPSGGRREAFVWNETGGTTILPKLPAFTQESDAWDMSADGQTVVGSSRRNFGGDEAVQWTRAGGAWSIEPLGVLPGATFSFATAISDDGSLIGGASSAGSGETGFLWTKATGMVTINQYAALHGLDLTGWHFTRVEDISADGSSICAKGISNGLVYGVVINNIPSPTSALLFAVAGLVGVSRRRRS